MNNILQLKGKLEQQKSNNTPGASNIPKNKTVSTSHLKKLKNNLESLEKFWNDEKLDIKPLVSAYYIDVIAKSNRIKGILYSNLKKNNDAIVGAKFTKDTKEKHIITYCVDYNIIKDSIVNISKAIEICEKNFGGNISHNDIEKINNKKYENLFSRQYLSKSRFVNIIVDAYYLEKFDVDRDPTNIVDDAIITIYDTGTDSSKIMNQLGIDILNTRKMDDNTFLLTPDQYKLLKSKAPYLISMAVTDMSKIVKGNVFCTDEIQVTIPDPKNEPTIGVIDTMFDENVYFSKWVKFENKIDDEIELTREDYDHGTQVTSIIVDGPQINPELDDGCGRFKVRLFGVAKTGRFSSFSILRAIKEIVKTNKDIKVWNLSLGSALEINQNFISPEAAILDKIQFENDVVFIVAGTNKPIHTNVCKIGAPADSINSIVVNAVDYEGKPANYSRRGGVLSFYNKPDICYYGGDCKHPMKTCSPYGEASVSGTSFAAPWIARKMSYLIDILGLNRELAKALIIDSTTGWENKNHDPQLMGYGIVPIKIDKIIKSSNDEIKFMITGTSEQYDTYSYEIPVPFIEDKVPYIAKATLCYFPNCSRNQGVDYTNTEMDIYFGRLKENKRTGTIGIDCINNNNQSNGEIVTLYEEQARKLYRKWDNVKHINEKIKTNKGNPRRPKKKNGKGLWGISIKTKERLNTKDGQGLKFGVVVTLRALDEINRIQSFIQQCQYRGWIVNSINVHNRIDIYHAAEEKIEFE